MTSKNVPRLRFDGFINNWNVGRLGDLSKKVLEKNTNLDHVNILTDSAQYGVIDQREFFDKDISRRDASQNYTVVKTNQYIYNPRISKEAKFGPINRNKLGYEGIVSPLYYVFSISNNLNYNFLDNFFDSDKWHHFIYKRGNTGARSDRVAIKDKDLEDMSIKYPNLSEQQHIGNFFSKLDYLIELHSQKLEQLKKMKRGYLQKLFPQKGENVPRLRFSGFNGSWKQEKAKKIFSSFSEKNHDDLPPLSITQNQNVLYRDDLDPALRYDSKKLQSYKLINEGDIVIGLRSFIGGFAISDKKGIVSPAYTVMKFKNTPWDFYFTRTYFRSYIFIQSLKKITYGIRFNGKSVSYKDFCTLKLTFPSIDEQKKIGMFFKKMDNKINLQENKISHLNKIKKYYLQKMFI